VVNVPGEQVLGGTVVPTGDGDCDGAAVTVLLGLIEGGEVVAFVALGESFAIMAQMLTPA